jgi:hypothetical protein
MWHGVTVWDQPCGGKGALFNLDIATCSTNVPLFLGSKGVGAFSATVWKPDGNRKQSDFCRLTVASIGCF